MAKSAARKPLPALAFLLALSLLTALVWWRVLHRADASHAATAPSSSCAPAVVLTTVPAPQAVTLTVLNSTQRTGLAATVGTQMTQLGFKVAAVSNDETARAPVTGVAEVRYGKLGKAAATLVADYVPGSTLVLDTRSDATVDLALGAKYTALATAADVAKALASSHLVQLAAPTGSTTAATTAKSTTAPVSGTTKSSGASSSTPAASPTC